MEARNNMPSGTPLRPLVCEGYRKNILENIHAIKNINSDYKDLLVTELLKHEQSSESYIQEKEKLVRRRALWIANKRAEKTPNIDQRLLSGYDKISRKELLKRLSAKTGIDIKRIVPIRNGYYGKGERYNLRGVGLNLIIEWVDLMLGNQSAPEEKFVVSAGFTQDQMDFFQEVAGCSSEEVYDLVSDLFTIEGKPVKTRDPICLIARSNNDPIGRSNYTHGNAYGKAK